VSDSAPLRGAPATSAEPVLESPPAHYAGRTRYTELEYEAILANASIGIAFTRDRRFFLCNQRFAEMFGYAADELVGKTGDIVYSSPESYAALGRIAIPILAEGRQLDIEWQGRRKDGSTFLVRMVAKALDAAHPQQGTVWIVEDITEQRRAQDELQRVLAEQQALLDNVVVGIQFTRERRTVRCNRRFEEMFAYAPGAAVGASTRELYFTDDEFKAALAAYAEADGGGLHTRDQWLRRQDGSGFWCRISGRAVEPGRPERGYVWLVEDITERRRAELALERLVREQSAVLENPLIGIAFVKEGRVTRANRRFEELFGGTLLVGPEFRIEAEPARLVRAHARDDGTQHWYSMSGRPIVPGDPAQGSVWLFEDITQEREAEERIERAAAEQELILDNASVGIAFVRNRTIQRCNRFLEEMVRAGPGELVGQSSAVLFATEEDWAAAGRLAYQGTAPGEAHDSEWRFKRRDGSTFRCRTRGRRIDLGEPAQEWIWSFEDVTAAREADARVQRALAEQELILDNATVGIAFLRNRTYQRCNRRFEEMFGYTAGEVVGRSTELIHTSREAWEADTAWYAQMARGEAVSGEREYRRRDGSTFWCKLVGRAIDPARPLDGSIWIFDDVTAEHQARESLQASRDALERAVAERTAELQAANARAQHLADHDPLTACPTGASWRTA
jgi:PAS domain S-box-containing protein